MKPARARFVPPPSRISRDRWMVAYADMVTLLFACFASLYAARIDFVPRPIRTGAPWPGLTPSIAEGIIGTHGTAPIAPMGGNESAQVDLRRELQDVIARGAAIRALDLNDDARGFVITLPQAGSFPNGKADITPAAGQLIKELAAVLQRVPNVIRVEGHTDDIPIHTAEFASNWELSAARATRVVQFMAEQGGISPARLSAAGYGEFRPRRPNDSAAARSVNRRIDIVILNPSTERHEEPPRK